MYIDSRTAMLVATRCIHDIPHLDAHKRQYVCITRVSTDKTARKRKWRDTLILGLPLCELKTSFKHNTSSNQVTESSSTHDLTGRHADPPLFFYLQPAGVAALGSSSGTDLVGLLLGCSDAYG
jgi:hypothetical protein